ncbi:MAG: DUF2007 domain-containing protein, partial [Cyclobacteriaceae bacterium]
TLVFTGTEITASILKGLLETADIGSFLKNENESARTSGFGSTGKVEVFIMQKDAEKAQPIIKEFSERNP